MDEEELMKHVGEKYKDWMFDYDSMAATFCFVKDTITIYATPGYDGSKGIPVEINRDSDLVDYYEADMVYTWSDYCLIVDVAEERMKKLLEANEK